MAKVPYNAAKDIAPVTLLASGPIVLVTYPGLPVQPSHERGRYALCTMCIGVGQGLAVGAGAGSSAPGPQRQ